jgi:hypothetical protein
MAIPPELVTEHGLIVTPGKALDSELSSGKNSKYARFVLAALSSIPWVGAVINLTAELEQDKINTLVKLWIEEHQKKIYILKTTLEEIIARLDSFGEDVIIRVNSDEYLELVKETFTTWDQVHTKNKKELLKKLLINAGATSIRDDEIVRLFIKWIDLYHEKHFSVIRVIYREREVTRKQIWDTIDGKIVREDSTEADLFRYLIRDLSTGGIIRQKRDKSSDGRFFKNTKSRGYSKTDSSDFMETAFEDTKLYELTELGNDFVHYVLDDAVTRIGPKNTP